MTGFFPFQGVSTESDRLKGIIEDGAKKGITHKKRLEKEIADFKVSRAREWMFIGDKYFEGEQDILTRKRKVLNDQGELEEVENLPNNIRLDNQYAKLVDQKVNYLLAKPLTIKTEDKAYQKALKLVLNKRFHKTFRYLGEYILNHGLSWLYPYYNEHGIFTFMILPAFEVMPYWKDREKTILDYAVRVYSVEEWKGDKKEVVEKVEIYTLEGIERYILENEKLVPDVEATEFVTYLTAKTRDKVTGLNWERVPLIAFRYNRREIPLIKRVKSLQDGINEILSDFNNNMQEDARSTVLIVHNYDGQDLGVFRKNLAEYGVIKVRTTATGKDGKVESLHIEVNKDNYESILKLFKKAIIENGRGYDAKDDRMSNNPNQMNIQSMYSDIDLDVNGIETEFQASFEELLWFINKHLEHKKLGNFEDVPVEVIFNRDILINESEVIDSLNKSMDLPLESRLEQHPYVTDVPLELKRIKKERQERMNEFDGYDETFTRKQGVVDDPANT
ncbi:phage portal protein [Lysinibacillus sphaericus]|uniref:phage portal protein n=1 Tax=Lysinibacillus sphaericus TaxID=1421 RepID=UPI003F793F5D